KTATFSCSVSSAPTAVHIDVFIFGWFATVLCFRATRAWLPEAIQARFFSVLLVLAIPALAVVLFVLRRVLFADRARVLCASCLLTYVIVAMLFVIAATAPGELDLRPAKGRILVIIRDAGAATVLGLLAGRLVIAHPSATAPLPSTPAEIGDWLARQTRAEVRQPAGKVSVLEF